MSNRLSAVITCHYLNQVITQSIWLVLMGVENTVLIQDWRPIWLQVLRTPDKRGGKLPQPIKSHWKFAPYSTSFSSSISTSEIVKHFLLYLPNWMVWDILPVWVCQLRQRWKEVRPWMVVVVPLSQILMDLQQFRTEPGSNQSIRLVDLKRNRSFQHQYKTAW